MNRYAVVTEGYFDGAGRRGDGPYTVLVEDGRITGLESGDWSAILGRQVPVRRAPFLMPGLVEAHCHLFLDGAELDLASRGAYLEAPFSSKLEVARGNLSAHLRAGVTLVVDAGDRYGVNHQMRRESTLVKVRSAGLALRRPGRYGSFMALEVGSRDEIAAAVREIARDADDLKVILTGIIDFKSGEVKGAPQFDADELSYIVGLARDLGLRTFVHCSGVEGLKVAVRAGVDSIEHGFFMTRDLAQEMADRGISWVPTFSPVYFQWRRPDLAGWDSRTVANLRRILDAHLEQVGRAADLGVSLLAGSDAGSHGVFHGAALIDELVFFSRAGLPMEAVLRSATSTPRTLWGVEPAFLAPGREAQFITLEGNPFQDPGALRRVTAAYQGTSVVTFDDRLPDLEQRSIRHV